jgi:hypothetical protein
MAKFSDVVALDPFVDALSGLDLRHMRSLANSNSECRRAAWKTIPARSEVVALPRADPAILRRFKELSPLLTIVRVSRRPLDSDSLVAELRETAAEIGVELVVEDRRLRRSLGMRRFAVS